MKCKRTKSQIVMVNLSLLLDVQQNRQRHKSIEKGLFLIFIIVHTVALSVRSFDGIGAALVWIVEVSFPVAFKLSGITGEANFRNYN